MLATPDAAESQLRAAIAADPEAPEAHHRLTERLRVPEREAELADALWAWARVERDPLTQRERFREVATLRGRLGQTEASAEALEALLEVEPDDPEALDALMDLRAAQEHWPAVVKLLERRIEVEAGHDERRALRRRLASIHRTTGDAEAAMAMLERLLEESPEDLAALRELEELYREAERPEELRSVLERRLELARTAAPVVAARLALAERAEDLGAELGELQPVHPGRLVSEDLELLGTVDRARHVAGPRSRNRPAANDVALERRDPRRGLPTDGARRDEQSLSG